MTTVISIESVSKVYRLGLIGSGTLHEDFTRWWARIRGYPDPLLKIGQADHGNKDGQLIWALRDVSVEINEGEILGVIGRNGAGKSTLLKILSRVTAPASGEIKIRGRVASLLEVGTGFHPELTGRENIFLNGAILGMTKADIRRKFEEIVSFAEIGQFLETPIKRYSSGMYVRLAFAVAAHLDAEILIVDEVLAVGDMQFQKKCLRKMGDVAKGGRTVLFVSHNMGAIARLCSRAISLDKGSLRDDGAVSKVIHNYLNLGSGANARIEWEEHHSAPGDENVRLKTVYVRTSDSRVSYDIDIRSEIILEMSYRLFKHGLRVRPWFILRNEEGVCIFATTDTDQSWTQKKRHAGTFISRVAIPGNFFAEGTVYVTAGMAAAGGLTPHFVQNDVVCFNLRDSQDGDTARGEHAGPFPGIVRPRLPWTTQLIEENV